MRKATLFALGLGIALVAATPAFADCDRGGQKAVEGARVCQAGVVSVCSSQQWLQTVLTCAAAPDGPTQPLVTPMPGGSVVHIRDARYLAGGSATDIVFVLRGLCDGKAVCTVTGDERLLARDPAPRLRGMFNVVYDCMSGLGSETRQVVFAKGASQMLSCRG